MKIVLSKRLETIASFIPKGVKFADIGSDHAYIPCTICKQDPTSSAIAGEVREGPFQSALKSVTDYELSDQVEVRLGSGLDVIDETVTHIIIAGMGGTLIESILEQGKHKIDSVQQMILQPNVGENNVRSWLYKNNFKLINEQLIEENSHIYEILIAEKTKECITISEREIFFGPRLLETKTDLFIKKWDREKGHLQLIVEQMKQSRNPEQNQINQFHQQISWIEEELINES